MPKLVLATLTAALLLACASTPSWKHDEQQSNLHYAKALASTDPEIRAYHLHLAQTHLDQAQRLYLLELQAYYGLRSSVAAAAVQAYGAQRAATSASEGSTSEHVVCVPAGGVVVCP